MFVISLVIRLKRSELLVTLGVIGLLLLLVSSLMYTVESEAQPNKFGSIPDTMWWGVATLTTVGYGDVFPITPAGKVLSSLIAVLGLGLFAIPTGILASDFSEQLQEQQTISPQEVELLKAQLAAKDALLAAKDDVIATKEEMLSLLRRRQNRPN